jgi:hypothetical protein
MPKYDVQKLFWIFLELPSCSQVLQNDFICCHFLLVGSLESRPISMEKDKRPLPLFYNQPSKRLRGELTDHEGKLMSRSSTFE